MLISDVHTIFPKENVSRSVIGTTQTYILILTLIGNCNEIFSSQLYDVTDSTQPIRASYQVYAQLLQACQCGETKHCFWYTSLLYTVSPPWLACVRSQTALNFVGSWNMDINLDEWMRRAQSGELYLLRSNSTKMRACLFLIFPIEKIIV